jgi:hypothetical protein
MAVRAKFRLNSFTTELHTTYPYRKEAETGGPAWQGGVRTHSPDYSRPVPVEKRTLNFTPVGDAGGENKLFWDATPSGSLQLGIVNQEAWAHFELGKEYYLDFTPAE